MNLVTRYLGLELRNPLVASAGPLTAELGSLRQLEDAGVGAVVLPSIFEEQIEREQRAIDWLMDSHADAQAEASDFFPASARQAAEGERHLELVQRARAALQIPVIASLNGSSNAGWVRYARDLQQAGASAIELNIYFQPIHGDLHGRDVEQRYINIVRAVRAQVSIPLAVKIGPWFSAPWEMANALCAAGADGLVLFNRFYRPDIDLARLQLTSELDLSRAWEMRLPLLWIGVLAGRLPASLAATTGVEGPDEFIKYLLAGADVVMSTSALLRHGPGWCRTLLAGLEHWLEARQLDRVAAIRGILSHARVDDPAAFERVNERVHYIRSLYGDIRDPLGSDAGR